MNCAARLPACQVDLGQLVLATSAWLVADDQKWRQDWLDLGDWIGYLNFIGPASAPDWPDWKRPLSAAIEAACACAVDQGYLFMASRIGPRAILPAGAARLAEQPALNAAVAARLDWLAPYLPTANVDRSLEWYLVCEWWLTNEASRRELLAADQLEELPDRQQVKQIDPARRAAIITNLERLRHLAWQQFGRALLPAPDTERSRP